MADAAPCDVLVIGGGPAGSTAATLLAERGRDVVVLEKQRHPRFHVGESLLPRNLEVLERLGMSEEVAAMGVLKPGAEFVSDEHGATTAFSFAAGIDQTYTFAYQVKRAEFDFALFRNAERRGARLADGTTVRDVVFGANGARSLVKAVGEDGIVQWHAPRFIIDASGRDTFLAGKLRTKVSDKRNNTAAVFAHFRGADCRTGDRQGYITVHLVDDGWFWMIPLPGYLMSVGFVGKHKAFRGRSGDLKGLLLERIAASPSMTKRMRDATLATEVSATGNYSYRARTGWGPGYLLIGDAFGFVDPIFSSGVLLAMTSGEAGAAAADAWLDSPTRGEALARRLERDTVASMRTLSWLIYRINQPVLRDMFMSPHNRFRMREGLVSLLAGNIASKAGLRLPVTAFKTAYYFLSFVRHLGLRLHIDGTVRAGAAG